MTTSPMPDGLAGRYYEYWRRSSGSHDERKALEQGEPADAVAAHDWVADLVFKGGTRAVAVVAALAEAAPDGDNGMTVGIGPVEDLIYTHGDRIIDDLLDEARRTPALASALKWVSLADGSVSADSLVRLEHYRSS